VTLRIFIKENAWICLVIEEGKDALQAAAATGGRGGEA